MTIRGTAARPEKNGEGLWISGSCGVSVTAAFLGSFDEDAVLDFAPALTSATRWAESTARGSLACLFDQAWVR